MSAVNDRAVADGHIVLNDVRHAGVAVDDRAVLDIGPLADRDRGNVAADDGVEPEAGVRSEYQLAGKGRVVSDIHAGGGLGEQSHRIDCKAELALFRDHVTCKPNSLNLLEMGTRLQQTSADLANRIA